MDYMSLKVNRNKRKPSDPGRWHWKELVMWMHRCRYIHEISGTTQNECIDQMGKDMTPENKKKAYSPEFTRWLKTGKHF